MLTAGYLIGSCLFTCDSTVTIAQGDSLLHILVCFAIGFFVAIDWVLSPDRIPDDGRSRAFLWSTLAFGGWVWLSTMLRGQVGNSRFGWNGCFQWIGQCVLLISVVRLCQCNGVSRCFLRIGIACFLGTIAFCFYQYYITLPRDRAEFVADKEGFLKGQDIVPGSAQAILFENRVNSLEPSGPFVLTNSLAGYLLCWLVVSAGWTLLLLLRFKSDGGKRSPLQLVFCSLSFAAGLFAILLTSSRSAWVALLVGFVGIGFCTWRAIENCMESASKKRLRIRVAVVVSIVIVCGVCTFLWKPSLLESAFKSLAYRFEYWEAAWKLILRKPWFGHGTCNFQSYYTHVKAMTASESPADPHNWIVELLFAGGAPMLAIAVVWIATLAWTVTRSRSQSLVEARLTKPDAIPHLRIVVMLGVLLMSLGSLLVMGTASDVDTLGTFVCFFVAAGVAWAFLEFQWPAAQEERLGAELASLPNWIFVLSLVVMLIHWSAAGGWMLPGPMVPIVLFTGALLGRNLTGAPTMAISRTAPVFRTAFLAICTVWGADFILRMANPILASGQAQFEVADGKFKSQGPDAWMRLINIDRNDPSLPRLVANHAAESLLRSDLSITARRDWMGAFEDAYQAYIERDEGNWLALSEVGRWQMLIADSLQAPQYSGEVQNRKQSSYQNFVKAADLNPNSVVAQLQATVAATWCQDLQEAKDRLSRVAKIESATPHLDRKIAACLVYFPITLEKTGRPFRDGQRSRTEPLSVRGEPASEWLRNALTE
jgi:hypothetical protein